MPFTTTADACDREAAFLNTVGDGLPVLPAASGGRWDVIQAYVPRTPATRKNQIWVTRTELEVERVSNQRTRPAYAFELRLLWNLATSSGSTETEQRNFDLAINDVVIRVLGQPPPSMDKTHSGLGAGGFLDVAENPRHLIVRYVPVEPPVQDAFFRAAVAYVANDFELND